MNDGVYRKTTKGIEAAFRGKFMVLDVEGFDSDERDEEQRNFVNEGVEEANIESKLALFVLVVADAIIVNIKIDDIRCATTYRLLETTLKEYKTLKDQQASHSKTKKLIFFIRDFKISKDNLLAIEALLKEKLAKICSRINLAQTSYEVDNLFDLTIFPLCKFSKKQFIEQTGQIAEYFESPGLFCEDDSLSAVKIPEFFSFSWDQVRSNEELNMPSIERFKAKLKADLIVRALIEEHNQELASGKSAVESRADFWRRLICLNRRFEDIFNAKTATFHTALEVVGEAKQRLLTEIDRHVTETLVRIELEEEVSRHRAAEEERNLINARLAQADQQRILAEAKLVEAVQARANSEANYNLTEYMIQQENLKLKQQNEGLNARISNLLIDLNDITADNKYCYKLIGRYRSNKLIKVDEFWDVRCEYSTFGRIRALTVSCNAYTKIIDIRRFLSKDFGCKMKLIEIYFKGDKVENFLSLLDLAFQKQDRFYIDFLG